MLTATKDLLLPATVTGSWPRPRWYDQGLWGRPLDTALLDVRFREQFLDAHATVIADQWKAVGLQPSLFLATTQMLADLEFQANVKGVERSGFSIGFATWQRRVHSSAIPTPQTRWAGLNRTYYDNPEVDALIDRFGVTLNESERDQLEGEIIQRVTSDAVFYPLYINAGASTVRKGITGLKPNAGTPSVTSYYYTTWNILEWDRR